MTLSYFLTLIYRLSSDEWDRFEIIWLLYDWPDFFALPGCGPPATRDRYFIAAGSAKIAGQESRILAIRVDGKRPTFLVERRRKIDGQVRFRRPPDLITRLINK